MDYKKAETFFIAGVDIGNSTTEAAIAVRQGDDLNFLGSACVKTTGIKGTPDNAEGILNVLKEASAKTEHTLHDLDVICINAAIPVIGDLSMATITETVITGSAMIGHNPDSPGGTGIGIGNTIWVLALKNCRLGEKVIPVIPRHISFHDAAKVINKALSQGIDVQAAVVQSNEGVLISNRVTKTIPIVDEVDLIEAVPIGMPAAVEVAEPGRTIEKLSNPYGIASLLGLSPHETRKIAPIAISLVGNRSAVVIKTPKGAINEKKISVGKLTIIGAKQTYAVDLALGAEQVLSAMEKATPLSDVIGEPGTSVGGMLQNIKLKLHHSIKQNEKTIKIGDLFAVDTVVPQQIKGGVAGERSQNKAVGLAAMVWSETPVLKQLQENLEKKLGIPIHVGGNEIETAMQGALTTPGVEKPMAVLDVGGGSIDAAQVDADGHIRSVHLAGAGDMVTMLIGRELGIEDMSLSEEIKINPAAKVDSLFHVQLEDGSFRFYKEALDRRLFGRVVLLKPDGEMIHVDKNIGLDKLVSVRRNAKKKVFFPNIVRALGRISAGGNIRTIDEVVLVGGSALDFEMPDMTAEMLLKEYGVITGRGNVRGALGPRNAVATGLIISFHNEGVPKNGQ